MPVSRGTSVAVLSAASGVARISQDPIPAEGSIVKSRIRIPALLIALPTAVALVCLAGPAAGQTVDFAFHWAPSPDSDDSGYPLSPAVRYEVWCKRGSALEEKIATVVDTLYTLAAEPGLVQRIRVCAYDEAGRQSVFSEWSDPIYFEAPQAPELVPAQGVLKPNYPNPFNPETHIVYGVPEEIPAGGRLSLEILDVRGRRVRALAVVRSSGWHEAQWDGKDDFGRVLPTGTYFSRFTCGNDVVTRKMTMVK
jgi:hypothetical protein